MRTKVNLGLASMSIPEKIEDSRHIVSSMKANPDFPAPLPTLENVSLAIDALEAAFDRARGGGPADTAHMHNKEVELDILLTQLAHYVEDTARGDEAIILSSGMRVKQKGSRSPRVFEAENGEHEGEVILRAPSSGRASYLWEYSMDPLPADPPAPANGSTWKRAGHSSNIADITISGLSPGVRYWFRVAVVKGKTEGPWSDPVSCIVQ